MTSHFVPTHLLERKALLVLLPLVLFCCFFRLGIQPIHQWDEARTGINAIEMLENGDYINLHFGGEPDKIRAKPPLVIWLVATNFRIFGPSPWSLRLHSAIASVFIFLFVFLIIRLYESGIFALACCLVLLSVRGIIGFHVGRTGDFDAVLIAFLLGGLYFFLRYFEGSGARGEGSEARGEGSEARGQKRRVGSRSQESGARGEGSGARGQRGEVGRQSEVQRNEPPPTSYHLYLAALFWGLAFLTKGPAMGVLFPGLFLFLILTRQFMPLLKRPEVYLAGAICLIFPISWYLVVHFYGVQLERPEVSGSNAFERMFLYDLVDRFTQTEFEGKTETSDATFFFRYLKENFAIWQYLFYLVILGGIIQFFTIKNRWQTLLKNHLLVLSVGIWLTLGLFLSLVTTAKLWYFAPAIPFVTITMIYGFKWLEPKFKLLPYAFLLIWVASMYFRYLGPKPQPTAGSSTPDFYSKLPLEHQSLLRQSTKIVLPAPLPAQRVMLRLHFMNDNVEYSLPPDGLPELNSNDLLFIRNTNAILKQRLPTFEHLDTDDHYTILQKR